MGIASGLITNEYLPPSPTFFPSFSPFFLVFPSLLSLSYQSRFAGSKVSVWTNCKTNIPLRVLVATQKSLNLPCCATFAVSYVFFLGLSLFFIFIYLFIYLLMFFLSFCKLEYAECLELRILHGAYPQGERKSIHIIRYSFFYLLSSIFYLLSSQSIIQIVLERFKATRMVSSIPYCGHSCCKYDRLNFNI
jgi:hypothetical protein